MGFVKEFKEFLREYKVMALAIAFIIGGAVTTLVNSLVDDLLMPVISFFVPEGAWEAATIVLGPIILRVGSFASALLNFLLIALVVFLMAKIFFKEEKVSKK